MQNPIESSPSHNVAGAAVAAPGLAAALRQLLTSLPTQGGQHLTEIEADLLQASYLLIEAIDKLGTSFLGVHAAVAAQQEMLGAWADGDAMNPARRLQLEEFQQQTSAHANSAITALQFQDMTSQLIGRVVEHVEGLRSVMVGLGTVGLSIPVEASDAAAIASLESANRILDENAVRLGSVVRKAVAQTHMESGDIELF